VRKGVSIIRNAQKRNARMKEKQDSGRRVTEFPDATVSGRLEAAG
jgi:hypothetical protein